MTAGASSYLILILPTSEFNPYISPTPISPPTWMHTRMVGKGRVSVRRRWSRRQQYRCLAIFFIIISFPTRNRFTSHVLLLVCFCQTKVGRNSRISNIWNMCEKYYGLFRAPGTYYYPHKLGQKQSPIQPATNAQDQRREYFSALPRGRSSGSSLIRSFR